MDADGTRFHLLLGQGDWERCRLDGMTLADLWQGSPPHEGLGYLAWNKERHELTLQPRLFQFVAAPRDIVPAPARGEDPLNKRRGAGRDRFGNWYWIDETNREIRVNSAGTRTTAHFWSEGDGAQCKPSARVGEFRACERTPSSIPCELSGLAVTEDHYLVVGMRAPAGLLIFDLHTSGAPQQMQWPSTEIPFEPFDMAARPGGGVWILDRTNARYWALDRHFRLIVKGQMQAELSAERMDDFQPSSGALRRTAHRVFPEGILLGAASPLAARDPIAIEALPDGTVLILDNGTGRRFSDIYRYRFDEQIGDAVSTDAVLSLVEEDRRLNFSLIGHDLAFVPAHKSPEGVSGDRLYIVAADGNQTFVFSLSCHRNRLALTPLPEYLPMRLFGGKALVAAGTQPYYDFADRWIPLVEQRHLRHAAEATFTTPSFDGREPDCVWHRLMMDACIPPHTEVRVWSRATNAEQDLEKAAWQREPNLYLRGAGSELPFVRNRDWTDGREAATPDGAGTWELLFQRARGRFLQLQIRLRGNERTTPRLRALRAYYPRFSYLVHYLPAVYREDEDSESFLDRFLANLEGFFTSIEDKIAAVQMLFDVRSAAPDVLEWLTSWFGVAVDPTWDEPKRRLFIRHAMDFFQYRGTAHGLKMALHLALDPCADERIFDPPYLASKRRQGIRIVEKYVTRRTPGVVFGDPTELSGLRAVTPTGRWKPEQGGISLSQQYTDFLNKSSAGPRPSGPFPVVAPADGAEAARWRRFSNDVLGFIPSATASDTPDWQDFLLRRYQTINVLNQAYRLSGPQRLTSFTQIELSNRLPADGAELVDWYQFEAVVLAMRRTAHRFTVLLPTPRDDTPDGAEQQRRVAITQRMVNLQKPAHTVFDVKFYWALFRIGEARLGEDTLIDLGSRAPGLMPPMVLGRDFLSESYLAPAYPQNIADRQILGRDRLTQS